MINNSIHVRLVKKDQGYDAASWDGEIDAEEPLSEYTMSTKAQCTDSYSVINIIEGFQDKGCSINKNLSRLLRISPSLIYFDVLKYI